LAARRKSKADGATGAASSAPDAPAAGEPEHPHEPSELEQMALQNMQLMAERLAAIEGLLSKQREEAADGGSSADALARMARERAEAQAALEAKVSAESQARAQALESELAANRDGAAAELELLDVERRLQRPRHDAEPLVLDRRRARLRLKSAGRDVQKVQEGLRLREQEVEALQAQGRVEGEVEGRLSVGLRRVRALVRRQHVLVPQEDKVRLRLRREKVEAVQEQVRGRARRL
jgi:hypothetical protein